QGAGGEHIERIRGRRRQGAVAGQQGVSLGDVVDREVSEGGDAVRRLHVDDATQGRRSARVGAEGHVNDGRVGGNDVVQVVENQDRHAWADGDAGHRSRRLLDEGQVIRRRRRDVEGAGSRAAERAVAGGEGVAGADLVDVQRGEGGDAAHRRHRFRAAERARGRVVADGDGDVGGIVGDQV